LPTFNTYSIDFFEDNKYLNSLQTTKDILSESEVDVGNFVNLATGAVTDELPTRFQRLLKENAQIRDVWEGKRPAFKSRSEYDMSMAVRLYSRGFSPEELYSILRQMPSGRRKHGTKDYFERTIGKAQEGKQKKEPSPKMNAHHKDYEEVARKIYSIRKKQNKSDERRVFEIHTEVAEIMIRDLKDRGRFFHDGLVSYVFIEEEKTLVKIDPDEIDCKLLLARYGINATEPIFKYLLEALFVYALKNGVHTDVHRFSYFDQSGFRMYLFNHDSQVYRISADEMDLVPNGTDGVLFVSDSTTQPFTIAEIASSSNSLDTVLFLKVNYCDGLLTAEEQRRVFELWFYSTFFPQMMPTKPLLLLVGEKGSGKTSAIRKVGVVLFGENFNVTPLSKDPRDFDAAVTNSHFLAIDNADAKCHWLDDRLAVVATGGSLKLRQFFTTNKLVEFPTCCFVALTSRTPHFRRDDVADRLLIIRVMRFTEFLSENVLLTEVSNERNVILSETVSRLQGILGRLSKEEGKDYPSKFRMADFYTFSMKIGPSLGIEKKKIVEIFSKLARQQSYFSLEEDPTVMLLLLWADKNPDREVTNKKLWEELKDLAKEKEMDFPYETRFQSFAQRISHLRPDLTELFDINERSIGGHEKVYTYRPKWKEDGV